MDPCPFLRILIGNLAVKFPAASTKPSLLSRIYPSSPPSSFYCKIKLKNFPSQAATVPLIRDSNNATPPTHSLGACFNLNKTQIDKILEKSKSPSSRNNSTVCLKIEVYSGRDGMPCVISNRLLGRLSVPLDLRGAESRATVIHNGWIPIGEKKKKKKKKMTQKQGSHPQLYLTVKVEPDPRFVFKFEGEPECSPQVFQVQGSVKQAVFSCKFGLRNSNDRNLASRPSMAAQSSPRRWVSSFGAEIEQTSKERKGWSITIHDLSGSPVAMASMVTPFVPSPGSDRVSRSNPGAWLILRPAKCTWKPWGRLEVWCEPGNSDSIGYRFDLMNDTISSSSASTTISNSSLSSRRGGKFTIDTTTSLSTPVISPQSSCDFGSGSWSGSGSRPGSGSGSDFAFCLLPQLMYRGFVMSSTVEGAGRCSKPEVEIGVQHVTCTEDAAAFVALAAAMDLSMDACTPFSQKLRKELRQQSHQGSVV